MNPEIPETNVALEQLNRRQRKTYDQGIRKLYREAHDLRQQLNERDRLLEQRVREISALNRLFRNVLSPHLVADEAQPVTAEGTPGLALTGEHRCPECTAGYHEEVIGTPPSYQRVFQNGHYAERDPLSGTQSA